jgi:hypothetical protein
VGAAALEVSAVITSVNHHLVRGSVAASAPINTRFIGVPRTGKIYTVPDLSALVMMTSTSITRYALPEFQELLVYWTHSNSAALCGFDAGGSYIYIITVAALYQLNAVTGAVLQNVTLASSNGVGSCTIAGDTIQVHSRFNSYRTRRQYAFNLTSIGTGPDSYAQLATHLLTGSANGVSFAVGSGGRIDVYPGGTGSTGDGTDPLDIASNWITNDYYVLSGNRFVYRYNGTTTRQATSQWSFLLSSQIAVNSATDTVYVGYTYQAKIAMLDGRTLVWLRDISNIADPGNMMDFGYISGLAVVSAGPGAAPPTPMPTPVPTPAPTPVASSADLADMVYYLTVNGLLTKHHVSDASTTLLTFSGNNSDTTDMAISFNGAFLYTIHTATASIRVWDAATGTISTTIDTAGHVPARVLASPVSDVVAAVSTASASVQVFNSSTGNRFIFHNRSVLAHAAITNTGQYVIVARTDGWLRISIRHANVTDVSYAGTINELYAMGVKELVAAAWSAQTWAGFLIPETADGSSTAMASVVTNNNWGYNPTVRGVWSSAAQVLVRGFSDGFRCSDLQRAFESTIGSATASAVSLSADERKAYLSFSSGNKHTIEIDLPECRVIRTMVSTRPFHVIHTVTSRAGRGVAFPLPTKQTATTTGVGVLLTSTADGKIHKSNAVTGALIATYDIGRPVVRILGDRNGAGNFMWLETVNPPLIWRFSSSTGEILFVMSNYALSAWSPSAYSSFNAARPHNAILTRSRMSSTTCTTLMDLGNIGNLNCGTYPNLFNGEFGSSTSQVYSLSLNAPGNYAASLSYPTAMGQTLAANSQTIRGNSLNPNVYTHSGGQCNRLDIAVGRFICTRDTHLITQTIFAVTNTNVTLNLTQTTRNGVLHTSHDGVRLYLLSDTSNSSRLVIHNATTMDVLGDVVPSTSEIRALWVIQ